MAENPDDPQATPVRLRPCRRVRAVVSAIIESLRQSQSFRTVTLFVLALAGTQTLTLAMLSLGTPRHCIAGIVCTRIPLEVANFLANIAPILTLIASCRYCLKSKKHGITTIQMCIWRWPFLFVQLQQHLVFISLTTT